MNNIQEFELIDKIKEYISGNKEIYTSVEEDTAIWKIKEATTLLLTTDIFIENVHFRRRYFSYEDIGYKSLAVNISDIASSGGIPILFLVSLGIPQYMKESNVLEIYKGFKTLEDAYNILCVGGDTVSSEKLVINIAIIGKAINKALLRGGAKVGDKIYLTGELGLSYVGFRVLNSIYQKKERFSKAIEKHLRPEPRVEIAKVLSEKNCVNSCIDTSDGLAISLYSIARSSNVGIKIYEDALPIPYEIYKYSEIFSENPISIALYGGEDYELLFTSKSEDEIPEEINDTKISKIGEIIEEKKVVLVLKNGKEIEIQYRGYEQALLQ